MSSKGNPQATCRLPQTVLNDIDEAARQDGIDRAEWMRRAIVSCLEKANAKGGSTHHDQGEFTPGDKGGVTQRAEGEITQQLAEIATAPTLCEGVPSHSLSDPDPLSSLGSFSSSFLPSKPLDPDHTQARAKADSVPAEGTPVPVAKADTIATLKTGTLSIFGELEPVEELAESLPAKRRRKARSATANDIEVPNTSAAHAALLAAKETAGSALPIEGCMSWSRNIKRNVFGLAGKRLNDHPSLDDWRGLGLVLAADRTPRPILPLLRNKGTFDDLMLRGASLRARLIGIGGDALAGPRMLAADMERLKGPRRLHVPATTQGIGLDVLSALIDLHEAHDGATWKMVGEWLAASSSDVYPKASGFSLGDLSRYGGEWFSKAIASAGRRGPATRASSAPIGPSLGHEYGASTLSPNESAMQRLRDRGHI